MSPSGLLSFALFRSPGRGRGGFLGPPPTFQLPPPLLPLLLSFLFFLLHPPGSGALCPPLQGAHILKADHYPSSPFHVQWGWMASRGILTIKAGEAYLCVESLTGLQGNHCSSETVTLPGVPPKAGTQQQVFLLQ